MLVLSRYVGQQIRIADDIVLTVLATKGDRIRLGIDAPDAVPIWRSELRPASFSEESEAKTEVPSRVG